MKLTTKPNPKGQREAYLFLEDKVSGARFKALYELDVSAENQPVLKMSVSQVDKKGKALVNPLSGEADVSRHSHTFTEEELATPGFDLGARVSEILHTLADRKEREVRERAAVLNVGGLWAPGKLDLSQRVPLAKPPSE